MNREDAMVTVVSQISSCRKCPLHMSRTNPVPGEGRLDADVMFIGEAPGRNEDLKGRPFVGRAGELLTKLIEEIGLNRGDVYITNVVKCRPPQNRDPRDEEIEKCLPYLRRQIEIVAPKLIVALGRHSGRTLAREAGISFRGISRERGRVVDARISGVEVKLLFTYHPAAALYNPNLLETMRQDFKLIKKLISGKSGRTTLDDFI